MAVSRTLEIKDLTPQELAELFCEMWAEEQAEFFAAIWRNAKDWDGAGWCQQSCAILKEASKHDGRDAFEAIRTLASHLPADDVAYIVAGSAEA